MTTRTRLWRMLQTIETFTMSDTLAASLPTLPVEMLHRIFEELDAATIVWSVRNVCQQLRAITDTYNRHTLDLTSVFKYDFRRLFDAIRPEHVTALILTDRETTPIQVDVFRSVVDIDLFTRLRSLTLLNVDGACLSFVLRYARRCSLTSLTLHSQFKDSAEKREMFEHLSSIIGQRTLIRLALLTYDLSMLMDQLEWPGQSKLQYLRKVCDTQRPISKLLDRLPNLETLVLNEDLKRVFSSGPVADVFSSAYSRLVSLTISHRFHLINSVRSLLSHTPSLIYLKITATRNSMIDWFCWEDLIKTKLSALRKFELHEVSRQYLSVGETVETMLNRVVAPFRTPFWTEEKRWPVIGTWHPEDGSIEIYTLLASPPNYLPSWHPKTMTVTNFARQGEYYTKYEDVLRFENTVSTDDSIVMELIRILLSLQNQPITNPLFPNVNDLSMALDRWYSLGSVPPGLDLSNVLKLSLSLSWLCPDDTVILDGLKSLLRQTPNIQSLGFAGRLIRDIDQRLAENIRRVVVAYVNPSKLRHLQIPICCIDDITMLLKHFTDLLSIKFDKRGIRVEYNVLVKYLKKLPSGYLIDEDSSPMFIKIDRLFS